MAAPGKDSTLLPSVLANFAGSAWGVVISLAFVPLYLHYLGAEGYGVVGFSTTLFSIVAFLDGGLTLTINREFARLSDSTANAPRMRDMLSAGTLLFATLAAAIVVIIWIAAPFIAKSWLNADRISTAELTTSLRLIGFVLGEQMIWALLQGALFGLHRQVIANVVLAGGLTVRAVGAILILRYWSATPSAFFAWYGAIFLLQILIGRVLIGRYIGAAGTFTAPTADMVKALLHQTKGFGAIAILSLLLSQVDKLLVSRLLPLKDFGYYMVAVSVSLVPLLISGPATSAFFPRLARLAKSSPDEALDIFRTGTLVIASIVIPVGFSVAMFSHEVIFAWTGSGEISAHVAPIVSVLIAGYAINASLQMSYYYEMAYARTRTLTLANIAAVSLLIPGMVVMSRTYGAVGVAGCWLLLNIGILFVSLPIVLRPGLKGQLGRYYTENLLPPYWVALPIIGIARLLIPSGLPRIYGGVVAVAVGAVALGACFVIVPSLRRMIVERGKYLYASFAPDM